MFDFLKLLNVAIVAIATTNISNFLRSVILLFSTLNESSHFERILYGHTSPNEKMKKVGKNCKKKSGKTSKKKHNGI